METLLKNVGQRIAKIREARELKQENVATILDISTTAYGKIERGETDVNLSRLEEIASVLEVDLAAFFASKSPVTIIGDIHEKSQINGNDGTQYNNEKESEALKEHISDLRKQVTSLEKQLDLLHKLLNK